MTWLALWHWLVHQSGSDYGAPYGRYVPYSFLSGAGSDLGEYTIAASVLASLAGAYHKHRCHGERRPGRNCRRVGRHVVSGSPYCNRHHGAARLAGQSPAQEDRSP